MKTILFSLLLLLLLVGARANEMTDMYRKMKQSLDPDNQIEMADMEYRLTLMERCGAPHKCVSDGPSYITKLTDAELRWLKHVQTAVHSLRHAYPTQVWTVSCALRGVFLYPELCQMHHASDSIAKLSFLVQKDLATSDLIETNTRDK